MQHNKSWLMTLLVMMAVSFILALPSGVLAATVLSGMQVVSGSRGTILSLRSENVINCNASVAEKTVVKVTIPGCVYGLEDFSYSKFEKESPVASIIAVEKKDGSGIELTVTMKRVVGEVPRVKSKGCNTYILLSKNAGSIFNWKATSVLKPKNESAKNNEKRQGIESSGTVTQRNVENKGDRKPACTLNDISMVYREQVCRINFKFSNVKKREIYKNGDSLICVFHEAENGLKDTVFELLPPTVYRKVIISENKKDETLIARIIVDTVAYQSKFNIVFEDSLLITIMALNKESSYNAYWSAHSGIVWEHELAYVKPYEVDFKKLGERAEKDVALNLTSGPVFRVGEFYSGNVGSEAAQNDRTAGNLEERIVEKSTVRKDTLEIVQCEKMDSTTSELKSESADMVVINADEVNIRRQPSVNSTAIAKAMKGMSAIMHKSTDNWTQITLNGSTGWICSKFTEVPESISNENKSEISQIAQNKNFQVQQTEGYIVEDKRPYSLPNDSVAIQKVSKLMSEEIIFRDEKDGIGNVILYNQKGRDPFVALHKDSLLQRGKTSIEQLLLVGVLIDGNEKVALFEDKGNKKYAVTLKERDAVENGKVLKIFPDRVVFLLTEFGISRSLTLHLKSLSTDQEARAR